MPTSSHHQPPQDVVPPRTVTVARAKPLEQEHGIERGFLVRSVALDLLEDLLGKPVNAETENWHGAEEVRDGRDERDGLDGQHRAGRVNKLEEEIDLLNAELWRNLDFVPREVAQHRRAEIER